MYKRTRTRKVAAIVIRVAARPVAAGTLFCKVAAATKDIDGFQTVSRFAAVAQGGLAPLPVDRP